MIPMPQLPTSLARTLTASPLRRRPLAIAFLVILALLTGAALAGYAVWLAQQPGPAAGAFLLALLASLALAIPALAFVWWLDRRERESPWFFFGVFLFGVVISVGLGLFVAVQAQSGGLGAAGLSPADARSFAPLAQVTLPLDKIGRDEAIKLGAGGALLPPAIQELLKALALLILVLLLRAEFDNVRDGMVYGALVGLGFLVGDTACSVARASVETGSTALSQQLVAGFVFLGLSGHTLFAALTGAGFGLTREVRDRLTQVAAPIVFLLLAVFAHLISNTVLPAVAGVVAAFLGFSGQALQDLPTGALWLALAAGNILTLGLFYVALEHLLTRSERWEQQVILDELAREVGKAITADEYRLLQGEGRFRLRVAPHYPASISRQIVNAQNELAFRKWRVRFEGGDPELDTLAAAWRTDIAHLRETT
jgi:RsiW-degrading membrane proteinase PrsW (M82 family)